MCRMDNEFVTHQIALDLKELGYNKSDFGYSRLSLDEESEPFEKIELMYFRERYDNHNFRMQNHPGVRIGGGICTRPLWQQAVDFLRDEFKVDIKFEPTIGYKYELFISYGTGWSYVKTLPYYEARQLAIENAIETVKNER